MNWEFLVNSPTQILRSLDWFALRKQARIALAALAGVAAVSNAVAQEPAAPEPATPAPAAAEPPATEPPAALPAAAPPPAAAAPVATETQASESAAAAPAEPVAAEPPPGAEPPKPKPPPYSLPWQLRPVVAGNVVRSDTTFAFYENAAGNSGSTIASMLLFSYKVVEGLAPLVRLGVVSNSPPDSPANLDSATLFINPVVGATYAPPIHDQFKLGLFLGLALPLGMGSGEPPDPGDAAALAAGVLARSAMDNAMFAVDYFVVFPGVGLAYVDSGVTLQVEATFLQLTKVRGNAPDDSRSNFTAGFHAGYFIIPPLSIGAEIRHQRWLSTPTPVKANENLRDTTTVAFGPRVHIRLGEKSWFRPGIAFALPLDKPMTDGDYKIVQLDLPVAF
jgi:hypothetical protein